MSLEAAQVADGKSSSPAGSTPAPRVAIVVVHGVADQQPGETAQSVADLLTAASPPGTLYTAIGSDDFAIHVSPMPPNPAHAFDGIAPQASVVARRGLGDRSPKSRDRHWVKSLMLSIKSDFQRPRQAAAERIDFAWLMRRIGSSLLNAIRTGGAGDTKLDNAQRRQDRGLQFTEYLLEKAIGNESPTEEYTSRAIHLERRAGADVRKVDVYEMYWADLSRLSSAAPRIVTEIFTMVFRLSRLGRDTVDEASRFARANRVKRGRQWVWLSTFQTILDWSFTNILAQLFAQLLIAGMLTMLIGLAAPGSATTGDPAAAASSIHRYLLLIGVVVLVCALASMAYFAMAGPRVWAVLCSIVVAFMGVVMIDTPEAPWGFVIVATVLLTIGYGGTLRAADDRFPFVFIAGMTMWGALVAWMAWQIHVSYDALHADPWRLALQGAVSGLEATLWLVRAWWLVAAVLIAIWAVLSITTCRQLYDRRASAATGRLGLLVALGTFLALTMAIWAGLETSATKSVGLMNYTPVIWTVEDGYGVPDLTALTSPEAYASSAPEDPMRCLPGEEGERPAARFLDCRFRASTAMFSVVAVMLLVVVAYLILTVLPSILAELLWTHSGRDDGTERLGLWLTRLYRWLDRVVLLLAVFAAAAVVWFVLVLAGFGDYGLSHFVAVRSGQILDLFVIPAATAFAALSAFGGVLSRNLPGIRAPLDAALDVDNYFREFPRRQIPRARIFARYRSLLRHVRAQGYDRVVIVSHSQGTVISAEFLRFISSGSTLLTRRDRTPRLRELMGCDVRLLTAGCPLRQLYAARFPTYYRWILDRAGEMNGPRAQDVGVSVWANIFGSGDYVGRWLWSTVMTPPDGVHPLTDHLVDATFKRPTVYDPLRPIPLPTGSLARLSTFETCTGFGAHTHYFDKPHSQKPEDRSVTAYLVDHLVAD